MVVGHGSSSLHHFGRPRTCEAMKKKYHDLRTSQKDKAQDMMQAIQKDAHMAGSPAFFLFAKCPCWKVYEEEIVGWDWFINMMPIQYVFNCIYIHILGTTMHYLATISWYSPIQAIPPVAMQGFLSCHVSRPWRIASGNRDETRFESEKTSPPPAHTL